MEKKLKKLGEFVPTLEEGEKEFSVSIFYLTLESGENLEIDSSVLFETQRMMCLIKEDPFIALHQRMDDSDSEDFPSLFEIIENSEWVGAETYRIKETVPNPRTATKQFKQALISSFMMVSKFNELTEHKISSNLMVIKSRSGMEGESAIPFKPIEGTVLLIVEHERGHI